MSKSLREALNESVTLIREQGYTVPDCQARYPEHATELRPLLEVALDLTHMPTPVASAHAVAAGRMRMMRAVAKRQRQQALNPLERFRKWISGEERETVWERVPALRVALAATLSILIFGAGALLLHGWLSEGLAQAAVLDRVQGSVEILRQDGDAWQPASVGEQLGGGDQVRTGPLAQATLAFFDGSAIDVGSDTEMALVEVSMRRDETGRTILVRQGVGWTYSRVEPLENSRCRFEIETPALTAAARGTEFSLDVAPDGTTQLTVIEGTVDATAGGVTVPVLASQDTTVQPGQTPQLPPTPTPMPGPSETPEQPGQTTAPQLPGQTSVPQPPAQTAVPQPGQTAVPQPPAPGPTVTPQPPAPTVAPQPPAPTVTPPGQVKTPRPKPTRNPNR